MLFMYQTANRSMSRALLCDLKLLEPVRHMNFHFNLMRATIVLLLWPLKRKASFKLF